MEVSRLLERQTDDLKERGTDRGVSEGSDAARLQGAAFEAVYEVTLELPDASRVNCPWREFAERVEFVSVTGLSILLAPHRARRFVSSVLNAFAFLVSVSMQGAAPQIDESRVTMKLTPEARSALSAALTSAGLTKAVVTSTERNAAAQAEAMIPLFVAAAESGKLCYGKLGRSLFDYWKTIRTDADVTAKLAQKVTQTVRDAGDKRTELQHVAGGPNFAFDISPGSISDLEAFKTALKKSPAFIRCIFPKQRNEPVFHLEVSRSGATLPADKTCNDDFIPRGPASGAGEEWAGDP